MRPTVPLALLALTLLAGCASLGGGPTTTDTVTAVEPPATAAEPPAAARPNGTVNFTELTDYQRAAFRAAESGGAQFVPDTAYVEGSGGFDRSRMAPFQGNEFVSRNGTYYRIDFEDGQLYATYGITATAISPAGNGTVVALADLPGSVRDETRTAVTEGRYDAPYGKWDSLPAPLRETDYVRYGNETFRLDYVVGDNWARLMTVEEAS